jgi:RecB family exonuclease
MLEIVKFENRSQLAPLFEKYNPREQSWLVPDLRTKFELQQKILDREGSFLDESVLRASDLWKILLKRLAPELRLVSDPFARSLLRNIMDQHAEILGVNSSAEETVFSYIDQLSSIIFHPEGRQRLDEWFEEHPEAMNRWKSWYQRAFFCAMKMVYEYKIITSDWVTAFLQNFNELERVWTTSLVVDLSGEVTRVEAEMLRIMARTVDVKILEPVPHWKSEFYFLLKPYEDLSAQSQSAETLELAVMKDKKIEVLRFSGMLAEIKNTVGQIREWVSSGIPASAISVIAPDIEIYWPVLQVLMQTEGLPVQKDITHKIQSLPVIVRWLATLRSKSGGLSSTDLEIGFFSKSLDQEIRYEEFKALFKSIYGSEDYARHDLVHKAFHEQIGMEGLIERDLFILKALFFWVSSETDTVQTVLREILQNASPKTVLPWKEWLSYLENIASVKEMKIKQGQPDGVLVTKLMSGHSEKSSHRIFLGLTDESLKTRQKTQLSGQDYFELAKDIGFYLDNPDQSDLEFELRMLADANSNHDIYCFGATDLEGALCSPSTFWMGLKNTLDHESLTIPKGTRWDELQSSINPLSDFSEILDTRRAFLEKRIHQDLGKIELEPIQVEELPRISASSIESFLKCPFIFAAQRYFKLKDLPDLDLDVDHRTRGQIAHALFEKLTENSLAAPMRFDWSVDELDRCLEKIRQDKKMVFADERLWLPLKRKHIQLGLRFLEFEKNWRLEFGKVKTLAREKRFEFYLDPKNEVLSKVASPGAFRISGQIDRIDGDDQGHLVVIDYKSSKSNIKAHGSWISNHELQLLFYMWVIEKSVIEDIQGQVVGLFYFIFRSFEHMGFMIGELAGVAYPEFKRKEKASTFELREKYMLEFSKVLSATLDLIRLGKISPLPADDQTCNTCEWRRQCRAPHLN